MADERICIDLTATEVIDLDDDSDLGEVEELPPPEKGPAVQLGEDVGDGVELVGSSGGLLAADLPHPRHDCPLKEFKINRAQRPIKVNIVCCRSCWCFVCQVPVASCEQWSSGSAKMPAHCNAHPRHSSWNSARQQGKGEKRIRTK